MSRDFTVVFKNGQQNDYIVGAESAFSRYILKPAKQLGLFILVDYDENTQIINSLDNAHQLLGELQQVIGFLTTDPDENSEFYVETRLQPIADAVENAIDQWQEIDYLWLT